MRLKNQFKICFFREGWLKGGAWLQGVMMFQMLLGNCGVIHIVGREVEFAAML